MNPITPYRYELDKTGLDPNNLVPDELHELPNLTIRCVAPTYGGFFTDSVIIKNYVTGDELIRDVDYKFGEILDIPSAMCAKEICSYVVIYNQAVTKITITYQALGGDFSYSMESIIEMLNSLDLGNRPVEWGLIVGKDTEFPPTNHIHPSDDIYGMEYMVNSIERVRQAILMGDVASHDEIYLYIDRSNTGIEDMINQLRADFTAHANSRDNPHGVTKDHVGLSNVQNYGISTAAQAVAGTINTAYMTPLRTKEAITAQAVQPLQDHINNNNNPHGVTASQVGLGNVQNYGVAITQEAVDGTSNVKYMTPLRVKEAVAIQAIAPLNTHINDKSNPHAVDKTQVGLASVQNYGVASKVEAEDGQAQNKYMTPLRVLEAIMANAITSPDFTTNVTSTFGFKATTGFTFIGSAANSGLLWTGSSSNPMFDVLVSGVRASRYTSTETTHSLPNVFIGATPQLAGNTAGPLVTRASGTGDENAAGIVFQAATRTGKLTMNSDGVLAFGGGSSNANVMTLSAAGNLVTAGDVQGFSDPRLKDDFRVIRNALETVKKIGGYSFKWREGFDFIGDRGGKQDYGFDAKRVQEVIPELVGETTTGDGEKYLTMCYSKIVPFLARAICELSDQIDSMKLGKGQTTLPWLER